MNPETKPPIPETPPAPKRITILVRSKEEQKLRRDFDRIRQRKAFLIREYTACEKGENAIVAKMLNRGMFVDEVGNTIGPQSAASAAATPTPSTDGGSDDA